MKTTTKIRIILSIGLIIAVIGTVIYFNFNKWLEHTFFPVQAQATYQAPRPIIDNRTVQEHIWDIMTNEYHLSLMEKVKAMAIVDCESKFNPWAIGDNGKSLGLWQIHTGYHKDITPSDCFDVYASTRWAIEKYQHNGNWNIWSCAR